MHGPRACPLGNHHRHPGIIAGPLRDALNRPGVLAAIAVYATVVGFLSRSHDIALKRGDGERLLMAADLLAAATVTRLSGGILAHTSGSGPRRHPGGVGAAATGRAGSRPRGGGRDHHAGNPVSRRPVRAAAPVHHLAKLSMLPLMAWVGSRVGRDLRGGKSPAGKRCGAWLPLRARKRGPGGRWRWPAGCRRVLCPAALRNILARCPAAATPRRTTSRRRRA